MTSDILLFIDDDFYLDPHYLRDHRTRVRGEPNVVASTGNVLADDVKGPGLTVEQAKSIVAGNTAAQSVQRITQAFFAYGCNMCLRVAPIREHELRFDETLPLYGWYEDWDFSGQLAAFGSIVHISNACGVHLSAKIGRITGVRMGYAQVANPIYLARKGTFPGPRAQVYRRPMFEEPGAKFSAGSTRGSVWEGFMEISQRSAIFSRAGSIRLRSSIFSP